MDLQAHVRDCYAKLAELLENAAPTVWNEPSLCQGWRVREVIAHVTMPARLSVEQFGAELAAAGGDFQTLSNAIAERDADRPIAEHLANLRSAVLADWQPPGGGAIGALNHAVVHSLDVTNAVGLPPAYSPVAGRAILDSLTTDGAAAHFGVDLGAYRLEATDMSWSWGDGKTVSATGAELISMICHRTLADRRALS